MSDPSLSNQLRRAADPIWVAQHAHPFLRGIGDGTLWPSATRWVDSCLGGAR